MNKRFVKITLILSSLVVALSASFIAGTAWAADPNFDSAVDNILKAKALLNAAENPGWDPPFGLHRRNAVALLNRALSEIEKSKAFADLVNPPVRD